MKVNVVIIGHVDHGKSTLIGRLLYDTESITEGRVAEIQKLAEEFKRKFEFAYFIDSFDDELKEERTIDTTGVMFKGKKNLYAVNDVPGHKEFIKNMLTGASHAEIAVLVVSATEGIQEQTRRHVFLTHMLGIKKVFALVNKMDAVRYDESIFNRVKEETSELLASFGYEAIEYIPGSAIEGDNIYKQSGNMPWYKGQTLIETLDSVKISEEVKPLRFVVQDNYMVDGNNLSIGRVESGSLNVGDRVVFEPSGLKGKVKKIKRYDGEMPCAETGDAIGIVTDTEPERGDVLGPAGNPPRPVSEFLGEVVLLDNELSLGEALELRLGTKRVQAEVKEIRDKIDSETGEVLEHNPDHISENDAAIIYFKTDEPLVAEKFSEIPELGRFILVRDKNIGAGIVLEAGA